MDRTDPPGREALAEALSAWWETEGRQLLSQRDRQGLDWLRARNQAREAARQRETLPRPGPRLPW